MVVELHYHIKLSQLSFRIPQSCHLHDFKSATGHLYACGPQTISTFLTFNHIPGLKCLRCGFSQSLYNKVTAQMSSYSLLYITLVQPVHLNMLATHSSRRCYRFTNCWVYWIISIYMVLMKHSGRQLQLLTRDIM